MLVVKAGDTEQVCVGKVGGTEGGPRRPGCPGPLRGQEPQAGCFQVPTGQESHLPGRVLLQEHSAASAKAPGQAWGFVAQLGEMSMHT